MVSKIRLGVFETNSSSTHSVVICSDEELEKWKNGELVYYSWDEELVPLEELEYPGDCDTYDQFGEYFEVDHTRYVTKSGEVINIICRYGYDS